MQAFLTRTFRLRQGELNLVLVLGFLLLGNSLALNVADVVAVSGFLDQVETPQILIVWLVDMLLIILATGLQSLIVDRFDRITLMRAMVFGFALAYIVLRLLFVFQAPGWLNYSLLYLLAEQQWLFFPLIFWILANDIFGMAQAKRLFPLIGVLGFVGEVLGLSLVTVSPGLIKRLGISSAELLTLIVLIYLLAYFLISMGLRNVRLRKTRQKQETVRETLTEGWGFVREVPSFRYQMLSILAVSAAITIVEFHFLDTANATFTDPGRFQTFYGLYYLVVTVSAIIVQSFVTSRLIERINLKNTFLILPCILLLGAIGMIASPGIAIATIGFALPYLTKDTIDESTRKAFQALVPEERRGRVSLFMDSYLYALGVILGCLVTGIIVLVGIQLQSTSLSRLYLATAALATLVAIWAILKMRTVYESSLLNWRLKRRQRRSSVLDKLDFETKTKKAKRVVMRTEDQLVGKYLEQALSALSRDQLDAVVRKVKPVKYAPGKDIVRQGEVGDKFYIIVRGQTEVFLEQPDGQEILVNRLGKGQYFGEMALIGSGLRTATVRAAPNSEVSVVALDADTLNDLLNESPALQEEVSRVIDQRLIQIQVQALSGLEPEVLDEFTKDLEIESHPPGTVIIHQGTVGETFYLIIDGTVEVVIEQPTGEQVVVAELGRGQYFGEMALISNKPRSATVRASGQTPTRIVELGMDELDRMMSESALFREALVQVSEERRAELDQLTAQDTSETAKG